MSRPRGFIDSWRPRAKTQERLSQIQTILAQYKEHLPLTIRQIFYRLVGAFGYPKTERDYNNLCETLNIARRAQVIPMEAIRDDGFHLNKLQGYTDVRHWLYATKREIDALRLDRQQNQEKRIVVWCEAAGMVPQLERVCDSYSIPVASSGGFDSTTSKHQVGEWLASIEPVIVLHIGDHDPSGVHMFGSLDEDVTEFADYYGGYGVEFSRLAVNPEQIQRYDLPTAPPKATDRRRFEGLTTQCESLDPALLAEILREAIEENIDLEAYRQMLQIEEETRELLKTRLGGLLEGGAL